MGLKSKIIATVITVMMVPGTITLAKTNQGGEAKSTLKSFLTAVKQGDTSQIVLLENDTRTAKVDLQEWHAINLQNESEQLNSYTILDEQQVSDSEYKFITKLNLKDGTIVQVPFKVVENGDEWKVEITGDSLEDQDYKELHKGNKGGRVVADSVIAKKKNNDPIVSAQSTMLASWNFTDLNGTMYSISSFNVNNTLNQVTINFRQWAKYDPDVAEIQYYVVQKNWYGDTVYGGTSYRGNNSSSGILRVISGTQSVFNGAQMKFVKVYNASTNAFGNNGYGEVYNGN